MFVVIVFVGCVGVVVINVFLKIIIFQYVMLNVISIDKNIQVFVVDEYVFGYFKFGEFCEMNVINLYEFYIVGVVFVVRDFFSCVIFGVNDGFD